MNTREQVVQELQQNPEAGKVQQHVDEARLWNRHVEMARFGATPLGGVNRQALTSEEIDSRRCLIGWARELGFSVSMDEMGNLFIRKPGVDDNLPAVLTGSHIDTQPSGGRFDGIYGVLAGLEAMQAIAEAGIATRRPIEVVAWM